MQNIMKFLVCLVLLGLRVTCNQGQGATPTGLYFIIGTTAYLPGDSIFMTDFERNTYYRHSLVCVTTNVNTQCCNNKGNLSEWLFPDGSMVPRDYDRYTGFYTTAYDEQIHLNRYRGTILPFGVYTCRVRSENSSVIHSANISILLRGATPPTTGLYFIFNSTVYLPGDSILITDIGRSSIAGVNAGRSLVCVTANVNTRCCRDVDGGRVGDWFFPNGALVPHYWYRQAYDVISRTAFTQQVRLDRFNETILPIGVYTCEVPDGRNSSVNHTANITLTLKGPTIPRTGLFFAFKGTLYLPGDTLQITDIGSNNNRYAFHRSEVGSSLVCITTNVNNMCCNHYNGIGRTVGWFNPDGSPASVHFWWSAYVEQVRLNTRRDRTGDFYNIPTPGVYTCRIPDGRNNTIIHSANITLLLNGATVPSTGLYFVFNKTVYLPGDTLRITDIGYTNHYYYYSPVGSSLVCISSNVNTQCCRRSNGGNVGEWFFPNGSMVPRYSFSDNYYGDFIESGFTQQVRLNRRNNAVAPFGVYTCRIPDGRNSSVIHSANILLSLVLPPSILNISILPTAISLTWSQSSEDVVDSYLITYSFIIRGCPGDGGNGIVSLNNGHYREYTLTGLQENSDYNISITAQNRLVNATPTLIVVSTNTDAPSSPPMSLEISSIEATSISIRWQHVSCIDRNTDNITGFKVSHHPTSLDGVLNRKSHLIKGTDAKSRTFTANNLIPRTKYVFTVSAVYDDNITSELYTNVTGVTGAPQVAGFYLNGASYPNNSVISLTDIGEGSGALYCLTNSTSCCQSADTGSSDLGQWILSNGYVPNSSGFFIERGPSVVLLNHKANEMGPTGIYTCRVPDASGVNRTMYIGVDSGIPAITSFDYNHAMLTLTCVSSGGLVNSVTWIKDGVEITGDDSNFSQSQTITDASSATYQHTLSVRNVLHFVGRFTCIVRDVVGNNDTMDLTNCPVGHYISQACDNYTVCVPCPSYSIASFVNSEMCKCLCGYYRSPQEDIHVPCTRPPSACTGLTVNDHRTRENSITVRWNRPAITGREDYYYNIHHSNPDLPGSFIKHNSNPYISSSPILQYTVSGLRPLTNYTIRVTVHNGVSDQDLAGEKRWCEVTAASGKMHIPIITSFDYNHATLALTCVSSGGPVDSVTWMKNGAEITEGNSDYIYSRSHIINDESSDTYQYTLSVRNVLHFVGNFTCIVKDVVNNTDTRDLTTCPVGHYISPTYGDYSVCVPCPSYSFTSPESSEICKCLHGYYRSPQEHIHVPCTRPPSACTGLTVDHQRTRENSITVRWNRPAITGRRDYFYNIHHSNPDLPGNFTKFNTNPYISTTPFLQYTVSGLRPLTNYTIRVTVHNGVSDQDLAGEEKRWCEVTATSGEMRILAITSFDYDRATLTLTCVSSGGPVDSVTWMKDGVEITGDDPDFSLSQIVTDISSATYQHTLSVRNVLHFVGRFTCIVRDVVGNNDTRDLTTCPVGHYISPTYDGYSVCVPCPSYSFTSPESSEMCKCLHGYYRSPQEDLHVSCTRPPSACTGLTVDRTRENSITVRWNRPAVTGREDYYYNIHHSNPDLPGNFTKFNANPHISTSHFLKYTVSGLRPLTNYTIRVTVHNGVSDQDPGGEEKRWCGVTATSGNIHAEAPRSVGSFRCVVYWKAPSRAYGVITGYDVSFFLPGKNGSVVVRKDRDEIFHIVQDGDLKSVRGDTHVKVRARTASIKGAWSGSIILDCPPTILGTAAPPTCLP